MGHDVGDEKVAPMKSINVKDPGLFRFIMVMVVMLLLILFVIRAYLDNRATIDSVNFEMEQHNFIKTLSLIRVQWLLEGRPATVEYVFFDQSNQVNNSRVFEMSRVGWAGLDGKPQANYCLEFWSAVINVAPNEAAQKMIFEMKYQKEDDILCQICDAKQQDSCIEYSTQSGISGFNL